MSLIKRDVFQQVIDWIDEPEVIVVTGPRQVGKTTLLTQVSDWLKKEKKVNPGDIHWYNLDLESDKDKLSSQGVIEELLQTSSDRQYLFIDEVQRLSEPGLFIKGLVDRYPQAKFVVSGSSSLDIRSKVGEVLTGRKHVVHMYPLSIQETGIESLKKLMLTGGYPAVFTTKDSSKQKARLEEIVQSYLDKDIQDFLGVELIEEYRKLMVLLADQIGQLINVSKFSRELNIHFQTVERYLSILNQTYILNLVYPYGSKASVEIVKSPVPYYVDLGIRNYLLQSFAEIPERQDKGALFENLVYTELLKSISAGIQIRYWRTKSGKEVDLVLTNRLKPLPVEVKFSHLDQPLVTSSMKAFIETYEPDTFVVVNLSLTAQKRWGSANIIYTTLDKLPDLVLGYKW